MHFLILGAGGIGCYYGARLQQAGHQVSLVARGDHLRAMRERGLEVRHPDFNFEQPVQAFALDEMLQQVEPGQVDLVVLTIKATQTGEVMSQMQAWLELPRQRAFVLSLQNGIDNEEVIAALMGEERTLGGLAVRIGGHVVSPGVVEATGPAQIVMGPWPSTVAGQNPGDEVENIAACFREAGIPTTVSTDIRLELWKKLLINNGVNPLSALTGLDTRALTAHSVYGDIVYQLMQEVAMVAQAEGIALGPRDVEDMYELICSFDAIKTSMLVDREKGRPLETDAICGAVLRRARSHAIPAPLTALVDALLSGAAQ